MLGELYTVPYDYENSSEISAACALSGGTPPTNSIGNQYQTEFPDVTFTRDGCTLNVTASSLTDPNYYEIEIKDSMTNELRGTYSAVVPEGETRFTVPHVTTKQLASPMPELH